MTGKVGLQWQAVLVHCRGTCHRSAEQDINSSVDIFQGIVTGQAVGRKDDMMNSNASDTSRFMVEGNQEQTMFL
jgi:hypothetical protein